MRRRGTRKRSEDAADAGTTTGPVTRSRSRSATRRGGRRSAPADSHLPVVVVGAGLAGSLLAKYFAQRGWPVHVYESRVDSRTSDIFEGRSINLALSTRGRAALRRVGLEDELVAGALPMPGRLVHSLDGKVDFQAYGQPGQAIYSVSRRVVNETLLNAAQEHGKRVKLMFQHKCTRMDLDAKPPVVYVTDTKTGEEKRVEARLIVGADGVFSIVRRQLQRVSGFNFSQKYINHLYKELSIPPGDDGGFRIPPEGLHIWPRGDFMMIALPNQDCSFTCTLFMDKKQFDELGEDDEAVLAFMQQQFPDAVPLMPDLLDTWHANPASSLVMIRTEPYHYKTSAVLIGDAAHGVVPFYGQGMNCSFEDCNVLDQLLDRFNEDLSQVLPEYSRVRKPNCDAVSDLSLSNYIEMRSKVASSTFVMRKRFEKLLHRLMPNTWIPLYSMVSFTNLPYAEVVRRARRQDAVIARLAGLAYVAVFIFFAFLLSFNVELLRQVAGSSRR